MSDPSSVRGVYHPTAPWVELREYLPFRSNFGCEWVAFVECYTAYVVSKSSDTLRFWRPR